MEKWGCIQAGVVLFQNRFLTEVVLGFEWGEVLFKSGVAFKWIRYVMHMYLSIGNNEHPMHLFLLASLLNGSSLYFVIGRHSSNFLHIS